MNSADLQELMNTLSGIKEELSVLKEHSNMVATIIEGDHIVPTETVEQLITTAQEYREKVNMLQQAGAKLSISFDLSLSEMETAISAAHALAIMESTRGIIQDYFRLTAEAEAIRYALESSKKILASKCATPDFQSSDGIMPYRMVVDKVKSGVERLTDIEYDAIDAGISRSIARAADKTSDIKYDSTFAIDEYLDGSCELLRPVIEEPKNDNNQISDHPAKAPEDTRYEEKKPLSAVDETSDSEDRANEEVPTISGTDTIPLWDTFDGYAKQCSVSKLDTGEGALGASKFINVATQKEEIVPTLNLLGNQKLLSCEDLSRSNNDFFVPSEDTCTYLLKNNYITELTITHRNSSHSFWTLTSKGWACFTKSDIHKFLARTTPNLIVPKSMRISISDFTPANSLRAMMIHDFFVNMEPPTNFVLSFKNKEGCLFGVNSSEACTPIAACAAVFEEGAEQSELEAIRLLVSGLLPEHTLRIIVFSENDLYKLIDALQLDCKSKNSVVFCLASDMSKEYDVNGSPLTVNQSVVEPVAPLDPVIGLSAEAATAAASDTNAFERNEAEESRTSTLEPQSCHVKPEENDSSKNQISFLPFQNGSTEESPSIDVMEAGSIASISMQSDDDSVEAICSKILGSDNPLSCSIQFNLTIALLLKEKRLLEATALAKTFADADSNEKYLCIYNALLGATNLPLGSFEYIGDKMDMPTRGETDRLLQYCRIAAATRAMCFPEKEYDHVLYNAMSAFAKNDFDFVMPDGLSAVKTVLLTLAEDLKQLSYSHDGKGFSETVLNALASESSALHQMNELQRLAKERCTAPHSKIGLTGLETFMRESMGPTSAIGHCMEWIAAGDQTHLSDIRDVFRSFADEGTDLISTEKIYQFIDDRWDTLYRQNSDIKVKKLTNESAAKNSLLFDLQKRLKIIADWLKPSKRSDSALNFQQVSQYRRIAGLLKKQIEAVCKDTNKLLASGSLDSVDAGGISLFHCVFDQISDILSGTVYQAQDPVTCFVNLLRSGQLVLNREGYPVLDRELNSLVGMEPWRMMLRHILEAKTSLPETLANIENRGRDTYRYEDYGCAEAIRQALSLDSVDYTDLCKAAAIDAHRSESDFEGEMGLMTSLTHF